MKKDAFIEERLNYKDKFLEKNVFQWESMAYLPDSHLQLQLNSDYAHVFVRKMADENGIVMPFTYVGKGKMTNPRNQIKFDLKRKRDVVTYLYDIVMENELPDYLQYDFGVADREGE